MWFARSRRLTDRVDDLGGEARELAEELAALPVEALDLPFVLVEAALRLVELARAQHRLVLALDAGNAAGDLVAEVRIGLPLDRPLGDALDDRGGVLDPHLARALLRLRPAHAARAHEVDAERVLGEQLEEAVALQVVREREERVRARDAEELALLGGAPGGRPGRLPEHEEGRCLRPFELGD